MVILNGEHKIHLYKIDPQPLNVSVFIWMQSLKPFGQSNTEF